MQQQEPLALGGIYRLAQRLLGGHRSDSLIETCRQAKDIDRENRPEKEWPRTAGPSTGDV